MEKSTNKGEQAFINALLSLMEEKPYNQISVSELSELAEYDRRTYYRYFKSKDDILFSHCASLLSEMAASLGEKLDQLLYQQVGLKVHDDLPDDLAQVSEFSRYAYYFTLGGLWQMLVLWIRDGMTLTPEQLTEHVLTSFSEMQKMI